MKAKRIILSVVGVLVGLVALVVILWFNEIRTIASVHQVDSDGYLYEMEYSARYDLDDIIEQDIDDNARLLRYVMSKLSKGL